MLTALTCPWCGAPLPGNALNAAAQAVVVACAYCGATSSLTGARAIKVQPGVVGPAMPVSDPDFFGRVAEAFKAARHGGASAHEALVAAARARLGAMGQTEAFTRVCLALARDFDAANGTDTMNDPLCMARMIEVYLLAIDGVRTSGAYKANMPFFTVTPQGVPVHFERTLTAEAIAELAARSAS